MDHLSHLPPSDSVPAAVLSRIEADFAKCRAQADVKESKLRTEIAALVARLKARMEEVATLTDKAGKFDALCQSLEALLPSV